MGHRRIVIVTPLRLVPAWAQSCWRHWQLGNAWGEAVNSRSVALQPLLGSRAITRNNIKDHRLAPQITTSLSGVLYPGSHIAW